MGWFERTASGDLGRWYVKPTTEFFAAIIGESNPWLLKDFKTCVDPFIHGT